MKKIDLPMHIMKMFHLPKISKINLSGPKAMIAHMEELGIEKAVLMSTGERKAPLGNNRVCQKICEKYPDKFSLRFGPCFSHASIMTYTKVYNEIGGYTVSKRTMRSQDYDLWFRFFAKGFIGANLQEPLYFFREDENAFLRRKPNLYLWAMVTRWKGFRLLNYPIKYYWRVLTPFVALFRNEVRKFKAKMSLNNKKD